MNNTNPEARANEIRDLVSSTDLKRAINKLMDFVKDFSNNKKRLQESIIIKSNHSDFNQDIRLGIRDDVTRNRLTELKLQILELLDLILDDYKATVSKTNDVVNAIYKQVEPFQEAIDSRPHENAGIKNKTETKSETRLETARRRFLEERNEVVSSNVVFEGQGICKAYRSKSIKFNLSDININLKIGEITAIVGENGNGKTTLLRIIAGELAKSKGEIHYPALTLNSKRDLFSIKRKIAYIPQELPKWDGVLADNLHFTASMHGITNVDNQVEVDFVLSRLGLDKYKKARWNEISGGYKMRFALAKALICDPKLIILDEPLANMDINTQILFLQDLTDLANSIRNPRAIIISSQQLYEVEKIADNIIFIKDGCAVYNGSIKDIGRNREENYYEIGCELSKEKIEEVTDELNYKRIEEIGNNFIIHTNKDVTATKLLKVFVEHNIQIKYFRDISKSTRIFFLNRY